MEHPALGIARVPQKPTRLDWAIVGVLAAWGVLEGLFVEGPGEPWARVLMGILWSLPLLFRRRWPLLSIVAILALFLPWALAADVGEHGAMPFPALLVAVFSCGLHMRSAPIALLSIPITLGAAITVSQTDYWYGQAAKVSDYLVFVIMASAAWGFGRVIRRRAAQLDTARAEGGELAREAVAAERARIARELHDVVAHSVSIIAMQAGAAGELVERDPKQAREHMETVRLTAQDAMREMRRLVEVLREDEPTYVPQPTLARVGELVEDARVAGVPVEVEEVGERRELPPGIDLTGYRIVQEALTNVRKHAAGATTRLRLKYEPEAVDILVVNERVNGATAAAAQNGGGGGFGLAGMRERVRLYGGRVEAAPVPDGGFLVHAWLPLPEEAGR